MTPAEGGDRRDAGSCGAAYRFAASKVRGRRDLLRYTKGHLTFHSVRSNALRVPSRLAPENGKIGGTHEQEYNGLKTVVPVEMIALIVSGKRLPTVCYSIRSTIDHISNSIAP